MYLTYNLSTTNLKMILYSISYIKYKTMKYLFPHQEECIREIKHHFDHNIKPQDILADGNYSNRALVKAFESSP